MHLVPLVSYYKEVFGIELLTKVEMPLKEETINNYY